MKNNNSFKRSESLAEMIGIILGDGSLTTKKYGLTISLNAVDEAEYVHYVKNLTDTDGSISINRREKSFSITFKSASYPLAEDFQAMSQSLGLKPHPKITKATVISEVTGKTAYGYQVTISSKREIKKFLDIIQPKKWEFGKEKLAEKLRKIGTTLEGALQYKMPMYSKENMEFLKKLFEQIGSFKGVREKAIETKGIKYRLETISKRIRETFDNLEEYENWFKKHKKSDSKKLQITKEELKKLIWKMPMEKIGEIYNVSDKIIKKWCIKWGIDLPPRGYWSRKENL